MDGKLGENFYLEIDGLPVSKYDYTIERDPNDKRKFLFKLNFRDSISEKKVTVKLSSKKKFNILK